MRYHLISLLVLLCACQDAEESENVQGDMGTPDSGQQDLAGDLAPTQDDDLSAAPDQGDEAPRALRGRFLAGGPVRGCGQVTIEPSTDGQLVRAGMDLCGDDMAALADTLAANLDALAAQGKRGIVVLTQGTDLPAAWLARCQTFALSSGQFVGDICLPWDTNYQADLRAALVDHIGPKLKGHPALAGFYFTITTMTNGAEMHFRIERSTFPDYPGDEAFTRSYHDVMKIYQDAFDVPILFEAGHCIWLDAPGGAVEPTDCATPRELYQKTRDTYGVEHVGIALWNCGTGEGAEIAQLLNEATADGASIGCQTVGSFTKGACRFTAEGVGDFGTPGSVGSRDNCDPSPTFDPEAACVATMSWFAGQLQSTAISPKVVGTWSENWTADLATTGVYNTSAACKAAIDWFAP
jgi:hypothetical protein